MTVSPTAIAGLHLHDLLLVDQLGVGQPLPRRPRERAHRRRVGLSRKGTAQLLAHGRDAGGGLDQQKGSF